MTKLFRRLGNTFFILLGIWIVWLMVDFGVMSYRFDHAKPVYYTY